MGTPSAAAQMPVIQTQPPDMVGEYTRALQLRQMQQEAPLRMQALQNQAQQGQLALQQQQQAYRDQQAFRSAMADPSMQGKTLGEIADTMASKGNLSPQMYQQLKKADIDQRGAYATLGKDQLANVKSAHDMTQELYNNVMNMDDQTIAQNWPQIAQQYDSIQSSAPSPTGQRPQLLNPAQPMTKAQLQQFGPMLAMNNAYLDDALNRQKRQTAQSVAEEGLKEKQASAQFYAQNGGAPGVSAELMQQADWLKKNPGKGPADYKLWVMQHSPAAMVMGNMLGGQGLDLAAQNYLQTGQLPSGLYRSPGTTEAIVSRAAQMNQQLGGAGIAANKAVFQANESSLRNLQKNYDQVQAFEQTAGKNIDLLQDTAKSIPDLGARFANVPVRMISARMIGTDNMAKFKTALNTAQTEAAKVLNSSTAAGQLSDSARHELQDIIDGNLSYSALVSSLNTLRQDMHNRTAAYQEQIGDIQNRLKNAQPSQPQNQASPQPMKITLPSGKTVTIE